MTSTPKVCYAIWDTVDKCQHPRIRQLLLDTNHALDSVMVPIVNQDIMSMIRWAADETEYTHLVVYDSGTILNNPDSMKNAWYHHCCGDWMITGHLMKKAADEYPYLHKQAFAINLSAWKECGRPEPGYNENTSVQLADYEKSLDNVHDDYTPLWIKPSTNANITVGNRKFGWKMISAALAHGYEVPNISIDIRKSKFWIYPEDNPDLLIEAVDTVKSGQPFDAKVLPNSSQQKYINRLQWLLNSDQTSAIFLYNTGDVLVNERLLGRKSPDAMWTTASGFKSFAEWYVRGSNPNCQINTYDFNENSLSIWQRIHREWDGVDFYSFMKRVDTNCDDDHIYCWGNRRDGEDIEACSNRQEAELAIIFGSAEIMKSAWLEFQRLEHRYHLCNLIQDPEILIAQIDPNKQHIIWLNNIFYFNRSIIWYGINKMSDSLLRLARALQDRSPNSIMHGQCAQMFFEDTPQVLIDHLTSNATPRYQCDLHLDYDGIRRWVGHPLAI